MKNVKLNFKGTYEEACEYIYDNIDVTEPTTFEFTRIVKTNAKQRRQKKYKDIYEYETDGIIKLNDNKHKENLFKKVCLPTIGQGYVDFERMGID